MSQVPDISAEIATTPPAADMEYRDDTVTRVLVRVERADGRVREYEAREQQDFQMNEPESIGSMTAAPTELALGAGGGFARLHQAVSSVRLSFKANPRYNLHIRTEKTAAPSATAPARAQVVRAEALPDSEVP